jgi:sugar/nucleoside kinase (ribokinase family)
MTELYGFRTEAMSCGRQLIPYGNHTELGVPCFSVTHWEFCPKAHEYNVLKLVSGRQSGRVGFAIHYGSTEVMNSPESQIRDDGSELVCIGSIVADVVFTGLDNFPAVGTLVTANEMEIHPGGCATNTSLAYSALGGTSQLIGRIGCDFLGDMVMRSLNDRGVLTNSVIRTHLASAVAIALVTPGGERTFVYFSGANILLSGADVDARVVSAAKVVHLADTFLLPGFDGDGAYELLNQAKASGKTTSMDVSWDPSGRWLQLITRHLAFVDVFFCGIREARAMTGSSDVCECAKFLLSLGPKTIVVKMGEKGSFIQTAGLGMLVPALSVNVVDTTGAGDCYVAAFLFAMLRGWDIKETAQFATAAGAASVQRIGATAGVESYEQVFAISRRFEKLQF